MRILQTTKNAVVSGEEGLLHVKFNSGEVLELTGASINGFSHVSAVFGIECACDYALEAARRGDHADLGLRLLVAN